MTAAAASRTEPLLAFDEARALLARAAGPLPAVTLPVEETPGLFLAEAPASDGPLPCFTVSTMDGYAVRAADLEARRPLPCRYEIPAGAKPQPLPQGEAARIFTGAVLPDGADTVVEQERATRKRDGTVGLEPLPRGSNIRWQGELMQAGDALGVAGELITPWRIALFAAGGVTQVRVIPRPRIALILTGSELLQPSQQPLPGQIRDSNGPMLDGLLAQLGCVCTKQLTVADDLDALRAAFLAAKADADVILTSGGVSVGDYDLVPKAVAELSGEILFHRLAIKPGKPLFAAKLGHTWLLGLPGNPVSVLCGWRFFARPLLQTLMGATGVFDEPPVHAKVAGHALNRDERVLFLASILRGESGKQTVEPLPWKGSHDIVSTARANAFLRVEPGLELNQGDFAEVYPL